MSKIFAFFLTFLLVGSVSAAQRLTDIQPGFSCDGIAQLEESLRSVELSTDVASGISKYSGRQGGVEATVVYYCDQGRLIKQEIIFTSATRNEANQNASEQKNKLTQTLGEPIHDGLNIGVFRRMLFGFLGADLDYLTSVIVWGKTIEDVMLSVMETEDKQWVVTISQGRSKMEYILSS